MRTPGKYALIKFYNTYEMNLTEIGKLYNVTGEEVRRWIQRQGLIRTKTQGLKYKPVKFNSFWPDKYYNVPIIIRRWGRE